MAVVKLEGLRHLAELIACDVPELNGMICVDQAAPSHRLEFPSMSIRIERSKYWPDQEDIHYECSPNSVVLNVGRHIQELRLRLGASSSSQRGAIEQKIINLFLVTDGHPGIIFSQLTACSELGPFTAAWELEDEDWQNEKAFDRQLYSELKITGILPALVTRRGVYNMNQIQLGLDIGPMVDPTSDPPEFSTLEVIQINEDGTFSPV